MARRATQLVFAAGLTALVAGCSWLDPSMGMRPDQPVGQSSQPVDRQTTQSLFAMPRLGFGDQQQSSALPASEQQCRRNLRRLGVTFEDLPPIRDSANCGIRYPVKVSTLARGTKLTPAATLNCAMAEETARWFQGDMAISTRTRYLSGVREVRQMSSYSCRRIRGSRQWSEHSTGNAIDIGSIKLDSGKVIDVARPNFFALRERNYLHRVRNKACDHFSTVLGPGSDSDHADHFHFDLRQRRSGYRHCD